MSFSIAGKTAIVTGAANGIGLAIGRHFADKGANVMFADKDEKRLKKELGKLAESGNVRYFAGDMRQKLAQANLLSATLDAFDQVDILVNACRQVLPSDPLNPDDDGVETLWQQNVLTALRMTTEEAFDASLLDFEGALGSDAAYTAVDDALDAWGVLTNRSSWAALLRQQERQTATQPGIASPSSFRPVWPGAPHGIPNPRTSRSLGA